jgi:hypothetical protein
MMVKAFLHSDKDSMYELGQRIGLTGPALGRFQYALYEVEFDLAVDPATGEYEIIQVQ